MRDSENISSELVASTRSHHKKSKKRKHQGNEDETLMSEAASSAVNAETDELPDITMADMQEPNEDTRHRKSKKKLHKHAHISFNESVVTNQISDIDQFKAPLHCQLKDKNANFSDLSYNNSFVNLDGSGRRKHKSKKKKSLEDLPPVEGSGENQALTDWATTVNASLETPIANDAEVKATSAVSVKATTTASDAVKNASKSPKRTADAANAAKIMATVANAEKPSTIVDPTEVELISKVSTRRKSRRSLNKDAGKICCLK